MGIAVTADFFWHIFESTGSIWAYLAYRRLLFRVFITELSLN
jgi:hypothetical protein